MIYMNKPGEYIIDRDHCAMRIIDGRLEIATKDRTFSFTKNESINPRVIVLSVQGERIVNLQFVPVADQTKSVFMPDYDTAEKFLTFVEHFINN